MFLILTMFLNRIKEQTTVSSSSYQILVYFTAKTFNSVDTTFENSKIIFTLLKIVFIAI